MEICLHLSVYPLVFYSIINLFKLLHRSYRGTYLPPNGTVQTETGEQHGDDCR